MLTGFGNGVRPADGIQIANNQPFYFQELSNTRPQPPQAVDDNNDHNPNNNNQIHHKDKAKHKLMQMLKMGIMFDMFEVSFTTETLPKPRKSAY